jgi:hypothetical protein
MLLTFLIPLTHAMPIPQYMKWSSVENDEKFPLRLWIMKNILNATVRHPTIRPQFFLNFTSECIFVFLVWFEFNVEWVQGLFEIKNCKKYVVGESSQVSHIKLYMKLAHVNVLVEYDLGLRYWLLRIVFEGLRERKNLQNSTDRE